VVEATEEECAALAARFDVVAIGDLRAKVKVSRSSVRASRLVVKGSLEAIVDQICVATLRPFKTSIQRNFDTI
ncbi:unnamed protein product, partial [Discosporangium mesarthrocarpum]